MKKDYVYLSVIILLFIMLVVFILRVGQIRNESEQNFKALTDSLETYVDKEGYYTAEISTLVTDIKTLHKDIQGMDKQMKDIKRVVDKNTISAVALQVAIKESGKSTTEIMHKDTVEKNGVKYLFPEYSTSFKKKFSFGHIKATKDSITWEFTPIIPMTLEHTLKRDGWFKPKYPVVEFKTENPDVIVQGLRSYSVPVKPKYMVPKIGLAAALGYLAGKL